MKEKLGASITAARRALPRRFQAAFFGRPQGLISMEECQSGLNCSVERLHSGESSDGAAPATIEETPHWKFQTPYYRRRHHSDVWVARLKEGVIRAGRYALTPDFYLLKDLVSEHAVQRDVAGGFATRRPFLARRECQHVALLGTHWCDSHFHWLLDVVPRIGILAESSVSMSEIDRYAIPDATIPAHVDALRHLGIRDDQLLRMGPRDRIAVEDLILPSLPERRGNPAGLGVRVSTRSVSPGGRGSVEVARANIRRAAWSPPSGQPECR